MLSLSGASINALGLTGNTQNFLKSLSTGAKVANSAGKAGRAVSRTSSILGAVGLTLEVALQLKESYDEQLQIEAKKNNRQNIRSEFNAAAVALEDYSAEYVKQRVAAPMEKSIKTVEDNISDLRNTRSGRSEKCIRLERIQKDIQSLIAKIHGVDE